MTTTLAKAALLCAAIAAVASACTGPATTSGTAEKGGGAKTAATAPGAPAKEEQARQPAEVAQTEVPAETSRAPADRSTATTEESKTPGQPPAAQPAQTQTAASSASGGAPNPPTGQTLAAKPAAASAPTVQPEQKVRLPQVDAAQQKVNLEQLPSSMMICTVAGSPISVGDYRRQFKLQQIQMQSAITANPLARQQLIEQSKKRNVKLTEEEKSKLLLAARQGRSASSAEFKAFLKQRNATEEQFNKEVVEIGLALKTFNVMLQQSLLNDMVNREILCSAARAAGLEKAAMNRYFELKHSPTYSKLIQSTGFTPDQLKDEIVKGELTKLMIERIQKRASAVTDKDIEDFYKKNPALFKHQERVRLSQIIISAPTQDIGPILSVRSQVLKANPKLSGAQVDAAVTLAMQQQRKKAEEILARARAGEDFAQLANEFTDDINAKVAKSGGDLGYQEKAQMLPEVAKAVWPLKSGAVLAQLVQSPFGFHIIKVTAHEPPGQIPLGEAREFLRLTLKQKKADDVVSVWLRDRRRTTPVALSPGFAALLSAEQSQTQTSAVTTAPH